MKKLSLILAVILLFNITGLAGCASKDNPTVADGIINGRYIDDIYFLKGNHEPGSRATLYLDLYNPETSVLNGTLKILIRHLDKVIDEKEETFTLDPDVETTEKFTFVMPKDDYTGYSVETYLYNEADECLDYEMSAVDVSSDWATFPRYGYLAVSFGESSYQESEEVLKELAKYHINGLFYFDVIDRHDTPLAGTVDNPAEHYKNLAKKDISLNTVKNLIKIGHDMNMKSFVYNLIFGAYDDYESRGINPEWGMYIKGKQDEHPLPSGWETGSLKLFNPANKGWQDFLLKTHKDYLKVYDFDGIQVDSLGSRAYLGQTTTYSGEAFDLSVSYSGLLNRMKKELNTDIIFNAVSEYGQDDVLKNFPDYDILFAELWTDSHPTYSSIKSTNDSYYEITGGKKGVVTPAYMQMEMADKAKTFNEPGVRFTNSVIIASGGSHLEMGDAGMLCTMYYADRYLQMTPSLERATRNTYSFMTAYENLLRGEGLKEITTKTLINDEYATLTGSKGSIWAFTKAKESENLEMLHLINLMDVNDTNWADNDMKKPAPEVIKNSTVRHYTEGVSKVLAASPDYREGIMEELEFKTGSDDNGSYVEFELPYLEYYTMVVFEK